MVDRALLDPRIVDFSNPEDIRQSLEDLWLQVVEFVHPARTDSFTTSGEFGREIVNAAATSGTQTITLHTPPSVGQKVTINHIGAGVVDVATAGSETINGSLLNYVVDESVTLTAVNTDPTDETVINWWATGTTP